MSIVSIREWGKFDPWLTILTVIDSERQRVARMSRAWERYHGQFPKPLDKVGKYDDSIVVNYCRLVVDKSVSFLFGDDEEKGGVEFQIDIDSETEAEDYLEKVWKKNKKQALLTEIGTSGAVTGHVIAKIIPDGELPQILPINPETVFVKYESMNHKRVVEYLIVMDTVDPETGDALKIVQTITRDGDVWRIVDSVSREGGAPEVVFNEVWNYPWPPIVDSQNLPAPHDYWGVADIENDIMDLNESLNFTMTNIQRILRYHAHPKTWVTGVTGDSIKIAPDKAIVLPTPEAKIGNLEMQSDLSSSIRQFQEVRQALLEATSTPEVAIGATENVQRLSALALALLFQPLIEKTKRKRALYGCFLQDLNARILALGGHGEDVEVKNLWPRTLPVDPQSEAQSSQIHKSLGVSRRTILERLGFDADLEKVRKQEEGDEEPPLQESINPASGQAEEDVEEGTEAK